MIMATCRLYCKIKFRWWVRPLIIATGMWLSITRLPVDPHVLCCFINRYGIKKTVITERLG